MPFWAPQTLILPPLFTCQPVRSLPLKSGSKPFGASGAADWAASIPHNAATNNNPYHRRPIMICLQKNKDEHPGVSYSKKRSGQRFRRTQAVDLVAIGIAALSPFGSEDGLPPSRQPVQAPCPELQPACDQPSHGRRRFRKAERLDQRIIEQRIDGPPNQRAGHTRKPAGEQLPRGSTNPVVGGREAKVGLLVLDVVALKGAKIPGQFFEIHPSADFQPEIE